MDAWRNQRSIEELKKDLEKQVLEMKVKYAALYRYMETIDTRTKNCKPEVAKKALKSITKKGTKK